MRRFELRNLFSEIELSHQICIYFEFFFTNLSFIVSLAFQWLLSASVFVILFYLRILLCSFFAEFLLKKLECAVNKLKIENNSSNHILFHYQFTF